MKKIRNILMVIIATLAMACEKEDLRPDLNKVPVYSIYETGHKAYEMINFYHDQPLVINWEANRQVTAFDQIDFSDNTDEEKYDFVSVSEKNEEILDDMGEPTEQTYIYTHKVTGDKITGKGQTEIIMEYPDGTSSSVKINCSIKEMLVYN
ncbi:hypothetical protein [Persicobacter psychrovividus]|uniref:Uncharacterized protein n=1 Tax=Persicobacter psychrovividus TaxID=387638 RepID=A0ABM7VMV5_9BACT|nr:hypothetical protein PEPS_46210 [Persicobacter psychrovividus]